MADNLRFPLAIFTSTACQYVQDAITTAGMVWHGMEIFTASTRPTVQECLCHAKEADVLVGIIAWRYGWEPEGQDKSITEMEYNAAKERLMFQLQIIKWLELGIIWFLSLAQRKCLLAVASIPNFVSKLLDHSKLN